MDIKKMVSEVRQSYKLQQHPTEWIQFLEYVEQLQPKTIVEIGIASGASTLCLSHFTEHIVAIDCCVPKNQKVFDDIRENCDLRFIAEDTNNNRIANLVLKALEGRKIDLLFIDGDHTNRGARRDFSKFTPFVSDDGIVAFHDIVKSQEHIRLGCKVFKFWEELKRVYNTTEFSVTNWGGIGIITNFNRR